MIDSDETEALFAEIEQRNSERVRPDIRASEQVLADYAEQPLLSKTETVALMQGFTPPVGGFGDDCTYLEDNANEVQRLLSDVRRGVLPMPCQPRELVDWSVTAGVRLPPMFIQVVDAAKARLVVALAPNRVAGGAVPITDPLLAADDPRGYDPKLQKRANAIAEELRAVKCRWPTKSKVAEKLANEVNKHPGNVIRRIRNEWAPARKRSQKRIEAAKQRGWVPQRVK